MARRTRLRVFVSTLIIGVSMAAAAIAPGWLTVPAAALAGRSVIACLLIAVGTEPCAAAAYLLIGPTEAQVPVAASGTPASTSPAGDTGARSEKRL